jgi:integrase
MSRLWPMLMLRGSTYYYHRNVPKRLRPLLGGKAQIWKSLRTADLNQAKLRSLEEGQRVERQFQALTLRARSAQTDPESLARLYSSRADAEDADWRRTHVRMDDSTFESARQLDETLNAELDALISAVDDHAAALKLKDVNIVSKLLDDVLIEYGLTIPSHRRREFALALLQAHLKSLEVSAKRTKGEIAGQRVEDQGITVDGLLEAYLSERSLPPKSEAEFRAAHRRFAAIVGGDKPAKDVTKADCRAYKSSLLAAPSNRSLSKDGKLSSASVKKLLGISATIYRFGVGQGHLDVNPFEGITRVVRGDTANVERRLPYDSADLAAIFGSPAFAKATGAKRFVPLIALYSACRLEEAAGLRVSDLRTEEGIGCFVFEPHDERRLKTASSRRKVAIHPELIRLGLEDYARSRPKDGLLFDVKPGPHGKLSGAFSKQWARFADDRGVTDPRKTFHSLRHSASDALRRSECPEDVKDSILGHSGASVGRRLRDRNSTIRAGKVGRSHRVSWGGDQLGVAFRSSQRKFNTADERVQLLRGINSYGFKSSGFDSSALFPVGTPDHAGPQRERPTVIWSDLRRWCWKSLSHPSSHFAILPPTPPHIAPPKIAICS